MNVDGVTTSLAQELAAMRLQVTDEVSALHAESLNGSRMTLAP